MFIQFMEEALKSIPWGLFCHRGGLVQRRIWLFSQSLPVYLIRQPSHYDAYAPAKLGILETMSHENHIDFLSDYFEKKRFFQIPTPNKIHPHREKFHHEPSTNELKDDKRLTTYPEVFKH